MKKIRVFVATPITLLALGYLTWHAARANQPNSTPPPPPRRLLEVHTLPVQTQTAYSVLDRFMGEIEPARRSYLGFELGGTVIQLAVDEGDRVEAGQVLARLDTSRLEAALGREKAALAEAQATRTLSEVTFKRVARLAETGAVASQERDDAVQRRDAAIAMVARAEAAIRSIEVDLKKSVAIAPFAGRIVARNLDEGTIVSQGQVVYELIESEVLEARVGVPADLLDRLPGGDDVSLRVHGREERVTARVARVIPQQDRRTRTVDVLLSLRQPTGLVPGNLVEWELPAEVKSEGAWLPRSALTSSVRGLWGAYAVMPTEEPGVHRLERRELELLHFEGDRVYVRGALRDNELMVADGLQRVVPGQHVRVVNHQAALAGLN